MRIERAAEKTIVTDLPLALFALGDVAGYAREAGTAATLRGDARRAAIFTAVAAAFRHGGGNARADLAKQVAAGFDDGSLPAETAAKLMMVAGNRGAAQAILHSPLADRDPNTAAASVDPMLQTASVH